MKRNLLALSLLPFTSIGWTQTKSTNIKNAKININWLDLQATNKNSSIIFGNDQPKSNSNTFIDNFHTIKQKSIRKGNINNINSITIPDFDKINNTYKNINSTDVSINNSNHSRKVFITVFKTGVEVTTTQTAHNLEYINNELDINTSTNRIYCAIQGLSTFVNSFSTTHFQEFDNFA